MKSHELGAELGPAQINDLRHHSLNEILKSNMEIMKPLNHHHHPHLLHHDPHHFGGGHHHQLGGPMDLNSVSVVGNQLMAGNDNNNNSTSTSSRNDTNNNLASMTGSRSSGSGGNSNNDCDDDLSKNQLILIDDERSSIHDDDDVSLTRGAGFDEFGPVYFLISINSAATATTTTWRRVVVRLISGSFDFGAGPVPGKFNGSTNMSNRMRNVNI